MPLNTFARRVAALEESQDRRMSAHQSMAVIRRYLPRWKAKDTTLDEKQKFYRAVGRKYGTAADILKTYRAYRAAHGGEEEI